MPPCSSSHTPAQPRFVVKAGRAETKQLAHVGLDELALVGVGRGPHDVLRRGLDERFVVVVSPASIVAQALRLSRQRAQTTLEPVLHLRVQRLQQPDHRRARPKQAVERGVRVGKGGGPVHALKDPHQLHRQGQPPAHGD